MNTTRYMNTWVFSQGFLALFSAYPWCSGGLLFILCSLYIKQICVLNSPEVTWDKALTMLHSCILYSDVLCHPILAYKLLTVEWRGSESRGARVPLHISTTLICSSARETEALKEAGLGLWTSWALKRRLSVTYLKSEILYPLSKML